MQPRTCGQQKSALTRISPAAMNVLPLLNRGVGPHLRFTAAYGDLLYRYDAVTSAGDNSAGHHFNAAS